MDDAIRMLQAMKQPSSPAAHKAVEVKAPAAAVKTPVVIEEPKKKAVKTAVKEKVEKKAKKKKQATSLELHL